MPRVHIDNPIYRRSIQATNRQIGMLKEISAAPRSTIGLDAFSFYNQITARANKRRGWIEETKAKNGITLTWDGQQVLRAWSQADFLRKLSSMHFASNIHLKIPKTRVPARDLHVVRRKAA